MKQSNKVVIDVLFFEDKAFVLLSDMTTQQVTLDEAWEYIDTLSDEIEKDVDKKRKD